MKPAFHPLDEHTAAHVAELIRAFSNPRRVRILFIIVEQDMNISAMFIGFFSSTPV